MSDTVLKANKPLCFCKQIHDEKIGVIQDINEPASELYVRQQGSVTFKFSVINKNLIAEATRDGNIEQLPIDGIPYEFQTNLNEEKITKIKNMLEQSYFGVQAGKVLVNVRGLGGWGTDVHFEKTKQWVKDCGLGRYNEIIAAACEGVDKGKTDPDPTTNPGGASVATSEKVQRWHFNTNYKCAADNSVGDSRIILAVDCLEQAIVKYNHAQLIDKNESIKTGFIGITKEIKNIYNEYDNVPIECMHPEDQKDIQTLKKQQLHEKTQYGENNEVINIFEVNINNFNEKYDSLTEKTVSELLGIGLHPLQDMFAHTRTFVGDEAKRRDPQWHYPRIVGGKADDVATQPERILHTEIATKLYLAVFLYNIKPDWSNQDAKFMSKLLEYANDNRALFGGLLKTLENSNINMPQITRGTPPRKRMG